MKHLLFCLLLAGLWADDTLFATFLRTANLESFSTNVLKDEQRNFEQFTREIAGFSCLSAEGKKEAIAQIELLQQWIHQNTTTLNLNLQETMKHTLRAMLSDKELHEILQIFNDSAYGARLRKTIAQRNLDILNLSLQASSALSPSASEQQELAKKAYTLEPLLRVAAFETKRKILLSNTIYRKDLQQGMMKLQEIFIKEGCAIE